MNRSPARSSIWKLPTKSGLVRVVSSSMRTNPGRPPRRDVGAGGHAAFGARIDARDEERIGSRNNRPRGGVEPCGVVLGPTLRLPRIGDKRGLATLNILWADPQGLAHRDVEAARACALHRANHAIAPTRRQLHAQQRDLDTIAEGLVEQIAEERRRRDIEPTRVRGDHETRFIHQHRGPGLALGVDGAEERVRQETEEFTMLVGQKPAHRAPALRLDLLDDADTRLDGELARMKRRTLQVPARGGGGIGHDMRLRLKGGRGTTRPPFKPQAAFCRPTGVLTKSTKPGSASTRW